MKRLRHNREEGIGNRQSAQFAKKSGFWCWGCDRQVITPGEKCPNCGLVDMSGKNRKRKFKGSLQ